MSQLESPTPLPSVPDTSKKKPFYKSKWFIILAVLFVIGVFASNSNSSKTTPKKSVSTTDATSSTDSVAPSTLAEPTETVSESNARKKAAGYLDMMAFSRSGLITQLEFEGFSNQDATYGADSLNADWNEQAAKKAASYLEMMAFSSFGLDYAIGIRRIYTCSSGIRRKYYGSISEGHISYGIVYGLFNFLFNKTKHQAL